MCHVLWMAADHSLPIINWKPGRSIYVKRERHPDPALREKFTRRTIYYVGSYEKCGCGFYERYLEDSPDRRAEAEESLGALARYAAAAVQFGPIELYTCYAGDESAPTEHHTE